MVTGVGVCVGRRAGATTGPGTRTTNGATSSLTGDTGGVMIMMIIVIMMIITILVC